MSAWGDDKLLDCCIASRNASDHCDAAWKVDGIVNFVVFYYNKRKEKMY